MTKSHFGTLVNCACLGIRSARCCELFSVFSDSQSSHALLLQRGALTKSISCDTVLRFRLIWEPRRTEASALSLTDVKQNEDDVVCTV